MAIGETILGMSSPGPAEALLGLAALWLPVRFRFPPFLALSASSALGRQRPRVLSVHTQKRCAMGPRQKRLLVRFSHSRFILPPLPSHGETASQHAARHSSLSVCNLPAQQ